MEDEEKFHSFYEVSISLNPKSKKRNKTGQTHDNKDYKPTKLHYIFPHEHVF